MTSEPGGCASCAESRAELEQAYRDVAAWMSFEARAFVRLREEIQRNDRAESTLRQVAEQRDALWAQLNPEPAE